MPANDRRHVPSHHHARNRTISAGAAAIIALALAACTATTTGSTNTSSPAPPTASSGGPAATLTGSGSTFDAPFFDAAFARYHQENPAVAIDYSAVGSSAGIAAFSTKQADFGASDVATPACCPEPTARCVRRRAASEAPFRNKRRSTNAGDAEVDT